MNNPSDNLSKEEVAEVRYKEDEYWGKIKEIKTSALCCICDDNMWVEDRNNHTYLDEGFKVVHPNAYIGGIPDYLKLPNALLECHNKCRKELEQRLATNTFLKRSICL